MYYEEQIIDGKLYYRNTPTGKWMLICYEKLLDRLIEKENKCHCPKGSICEFFDIDGEKCLYGLK